MPADDRILEVVEGFAARLRQDLDVNAQSLVTEMAGVVAALREEWQAELDHRVAEARAEGQAELDRRVAEAREDEAQVQKEHHAAQLLRGTAHGSRQSRVDTLERLMGAVRRIDESNSLTGILGALLRGAAAETSRVAILLVDGYMFRTWEHQGFAEGTGPTEMPIGAAGTLAAAVALKQTSFVPPVIDDRDSTTPGFMRVPAGHTALVVPLAVGGDVVAVLYADDASRAPEQEDVPLWTEEVQLLARHAAIRLENVTSVRTVEVLAGTD